MLYLFSPVKEHISEAGMVLVKVVNDFYCQAHVSCISLEEFHKLYSDYVLFYSRQIILILFQASGCWAKCYVENV